MGGRPPKTSAQHKADGTYRKDRQGRRAEAMFRPGAPQQPPGFDDDAKRIWKMIVDQVPSEVLSTLDAFALEDCCRWYSLLCKYHQLLADDPLEEQLLKSANEASKNFKQYCAKFGLSPVDRARIKAPPPASDDIDPIAAIVKMTQAG
jgi:phage terminase small subunit